MRIIIFLLFISVIVIGPTMILYAFMKNKSLRLKIILLLLIITNIPLTIYMTGFYQYEMNPNTIAHGWPIPTVIFQRDTPDGPWLDYVGPTTLLAYPLNYILFLFLPALILGVHTYISNKLQKNDSE